MIEFLGIFFCNCHLDFRFVFAIRKLGVIAENELRMKDDKKDVLYYRGIKGDVMNSSHRGHVKEGDIVTWWSFSSVGGLNSDSKIVLKKIMNNKSLSRGLL